MNKICVLGNDGISGGISNYIKNLVNFSNSSIFYFILDNNRELYINNKKKNFKIVPFNIKYNIFNIVFKINILKKIIQNNKIDIIHAHTQRAAFLACLLKIIFFKKNLKIVYTPHGFRHKQVNFFKKKIHLFIEIFILKKINHIILITKKEILTLKILKKYSVKNSYLKTSIPKIKFLKKISLRKKLKISKRKKIILMCGSVQSVKQPELFIKIATNLLKTNKDLYFVWLGKKIDRFEVPKNKNIRFLGNINDKLTYYSYMNSSDIFLMTSKYETFPITLLEARNIGLPILCNNFDGINDILIKNNCEFKFKYNDYNSAIKILTNILSKKDFCIKKKKITNSNRFISQLCKKHLYIYNTLK